MSPTNDDHGGVEVNLASLLSTLVRPRKLGRVLAGDVGFYRVAIRTGSGGRTSPSSVARGSPDGRGVSPFSTWPRSSSSKCSLPKTGRWTWEYFAIDVQLVWLVDPEARVVSVYRSLADVHEIKEGDRPTGGDVLPGFEVAIAEIFEE